MFALSDSSSGRLTEIGSKFSGGPHQPGETNNRNASIYKKKAIGKYFVVKFKSLYSVVAPRLFHALPC